MKLHVVLATGSRLRTALSVLYSALPLDERSVRIADTEASIADGSLDLSHMLLAELNHEPAGVLMMTISDTGVGTVWPPVVAPRFVASTGPNSQATAIEDVLLQESAKRLDVQGAWIGQFLLEVEQVVEQATLARNGFHRLTELIFFERSVRQRPISDKRTDRRLTSVAYRAARDRLRFASLLEATYHETLDCPELNGVRSAVQSLANHESSGHFTASMWRRYRLDGEDVGLLLSVNRPEQCAREIVYLGVIKSARQCGVARTMLADAIQSAQQAGIERIQIAADVRNVPARRLYETLGFTENSRKVACVQLRPHERKEKSSGDRHDR